MIYAQYGVLKFRETKSRRQWENSQNKEVHIAFTEMDDTDLTFPSEQLIVAVSESVVAYLCDAITDIEVGSIDISIESESSYSRLILTSGSLTNTDYGEGYYYIKIVDDNGTYYSDVYGCAADLSDQLKITITSSNFSMGQDRSYEFNTDGLTFSSFFNVWEKPYPYIEEEEEAEDNDGVLTPYYWSSSKVLSWVISGSEPIFDFLSRARGLLVNGSISIKWHDDTYDVSEIEADVDESFNDGDLLHILLKAKPSDSITTVINTVE